jgi:exonuclease SbcD
MQDKYVTIAEIEPGKAPIIEFVKLTKGKKLVRKKFTDIDEAVTWLNKQDNSLIELTIASDTYLTASDRRRLADSNEFIIDIIPEITNIEQPTGKIIDLEKNVEELFSDYFSSIHKKPPNKEHIELFKEILSMEEDDDTD